ncbi:hypothetical protein OROMI_026459 [Orobanche minor]
MDYSSESDEGWNRRMRRRAVGKCESGSSTSGSEESIPTSEEIISEFCASEEDEELIKHLRKRLDEYHRVYSDDGSSKETPSTPIPPSQQTLVAPDTPEEKWNFGGARTIFRTAKSTPVTLKSHASNFGPPNDDDDSDATQPPDG